MKRRLLLLFLVFIMIFSLVSCNNNKPTNDDINDNKTTDSKMLEIDENIFIEYDFESFWELAPGKYSVRCIDRNHGKFYPEFNDVYYECYAELYVSWLYLDGYRTHTKFVVRYMPQHGDVVTKTITSLIPEQTE